jgi:hypothetical protein
MVSVKHNLIQKQEKKEFKEILHEIYLLRNIRTILPIELIIIIYNYMTGYPKLLFNIKYNFLELNIKKDYHKNFKVWKSLSNTINSFSKNQLIAFIFNNFIKDNNYIYSKIWYFSKFTNKYYDKIKLLNLWAGKETNENFEKENLKYVNSMVKMRIIDAVYSYLLLTIKKYERLKDKYWTFAINQRKIHFTNIINLINNAFYIYKSLDYIININNINNN